MIARDLDTRWMELASILLVRLFFLCFLALCLFLIPLGNFAYYAVWIIAFIITIPYSLWLRSRLRYNSLTSSQFMGDLLLATGVIYFTGGVHSQLTFLYPLVILSAGIAGTPRAAMGTTLLAILTYMVLAALIFTGTIEEYIPPTADLQNHSITTLMLHSSIFAGFGVAGGLISRYCNLRSTQEHALADTTATLLKNIPVPALLLDSAGKILAANSSICAWLNYSESNLCETDYRSLCDVKIDPLPDIYGNSVFLLDAKGRPIPVTYSSNDFDMPVISLFESTDQTNTFHRVTLITFSNISDLIHSNKQLAARERVNAVTRLTEEMAHDIRTPLTALYTSVQLLKQCEGTLTAVDWLPNSPRRKDRMEILSHIEGASDRMDTAIQKFIDFTGFSPDDLISIIKLDSLHTNEG